MTTAEFRAAVNADIQALMRTPPDCWICGQPVRARGCLTHDDICANCAQCGNDDEEGA
jgi:hypothetical protein